MIPGTGAGRDPPGLAAVPPKAAIDAGAGGLERLTVSERSRGEGRNRKTTVSSPSCGRARRATRDFGWVLDLPLHSRDEVTEAPPVQVPFSDHLGHQSYHQQ